MPVLKVFTLATKLRKKLIRNSWLLYVDLITRFIFPILRGFTIEKVSLNRQQLEKLILSKSSFSGLDVSRFSMIFLAQFIQMDRNRVINVHQLMDEIRSCEGLRRTTQTKKASVFRKEPLKGLWKKHFTDASFILKNIGIHIGLEKEGNKKLDQLIIEAFAQSTTGVVDDQFINYITTRVTFGVFEERAKENKLTGEWIVFQKYKQKNYYLTLAAHDEGDYSIYKRVCDCYRLDYPHLKSALT